MVVVITADFHFGKGVNSTATFSRDEETFSQILRIAEYVDNNPPIDAIVVAGDLSHTNRPSISSNVYIAKTLSLLDSLKIPVLVFPGNHDYTYDGKHVLQPFMSKHWKRVEIVDDVCMWHDMLIVPHIPHDHLGDFSSAEEYANALKQAYAQAISHHHSKVLLTHAQIADCVVGATDYVLESGSLVIEDLAMLAGTGIKFILAGDVHKPQIYSRGGVTVGYCGSPTQTDYGERNDQKGVLLFNSDTMELSFQEIPGYAKYVHWSVSSLDDLPKSFENMIVDITLTSPLDQSLVLQEVLQRGPLAVRGITPFIKDVSTSAVERNLVVESYSTQLQAYANATSLDDKSLFLGQQIIEEALSTQ